MSAPRNNCRAAGDDMVVNTEALPPAERRDTVRRLVALCHIVNDLVELAETESTTGGPASELLCAHAQQIQTAVRDIVVDLVANGRAARSDAA
ncbi:hypothetical protein [Nocardia sp. NBC_00416]|uniref:hypothetical protein n=1 Tax=Nocardia sp. NBC_00416 TaxID=2975991 RepID=UPI002E248FC6